MIYLNFGNTNKFTILRSLYSFCFLGPTCLVSAPQGANTKLSLKHRGIQNLQQTYIYCDVKLHCSHDLTVDYGGILCLKIISTLVYVRRVMLILVHARSALWMSCVCGSVWPSDMCPWLGFRNFRLHSLSMHVVFVPDFTYASRNILLVVGVNNGLPRSHCSYVCIGWGKRPKYLCLNCNLNKYCTEHRYRYMSIPKYRLHRVCHQTWLISVKWNWKANLSFCMPWRHMGLV
jgi:hypothetical protein